MATRKARPRRPARRFRVNPDATWRFTGHSSSDSFVRMSILRLFRSFCILLAGFAPLCGVALAKVRISIDLSAQQLTAIRGDESVVWKISSGRRGYETPTGHYKVYRMEPDHHSDEYDQAPMPYSMFFSPRGLAIHGTYERGLGRPASHGCVRLSVANARRLYDWISADGGEGGGAEVEIYGQTPGRGRATADADRAAGRDDPGLYGRPGRRAADDAPDRTAAPSPARIRERFIDPFDESVESVWR